MKPVNLKLISHIFSLLIILSVPSFALAEEHPQEHGQHEDHEEHEKGGEHGEDGGHEEPELKFSAAELQEFSIKLEQAQPGVINKTLNLTGEVIVAPERLYHVVPRVSGVVRQVFKHLGDEVKSGDLLATLSSRDLADSKAEFVAADSLLKLANANLKRERDLYKSKVTAKREYLAARQVQVEMSIKRKAAAQRLSAIGLTEKSILSVLRNVDQDLTLYELRAPADGVIIEKHAAQGEVLESNSRSFTVANLSQVWVNLTVYQKDLPFIHQGQQVSISTRFGVSDKQTTAMSHISWLSPTLDEKTRSARARIVIENLDGYWRPGLFVNAKVAIEKKQAEIVIPLTTLQTVEGQTIVFVQHEDGDFEAQAVQTGRRDFQQVEIIQGLKSGQTYVSQNAFTLKAQMQKGEFSEGHSH
ncbi:Cobalt-zinc-cadmium resistance protein czcB_ [methanotrophic bacterial endosymbiont of Bathymodiolus sp.]|nr:Cobalt-zinc-cadmium resistance protein czcB_ [methanotrophic bacterial endosymbiont of Bathymodiolus sp.]